MEKGKFEAVKIWLDSKIFDSIQIFSYEDWYDSRKFDSIQIPRKKDFDTQHEDSDAQQHIRH